MRAGPVCLVVLFHVAALGGCGASALHRAAERGDNAALSSEIGRLHKAGKLSNGDARDLARIVARRELERAKGDEAVHRVRDVRACAAEIEGPLRLRMKTHDLAGAEAAMALFEDGGLSRGAARSLLADADEAWRAVGIRTLTGEGDADARRRAMVDASPRVRRSAVRAAQVAVDPADFDTRVDTARVDPDPFVRTDAVRAIALLAGERGPNARASALAARIAIVFRDLHASGDDAVKEEIAASWAISPLWEKGGRQALRVLIATSHGPGAIAGAGAILRRPAREVRESREDAEVLESATTMLEETLASASRRDRLHALALLPLTKRTIKPVKGAAADEKDPEVRVAALSRLLGWRPDRDAARAELEQFAAQTIDKPLAARARIHLANSGDGRIQAWIEHDLRADDPRVRLAAAAALAALGRSARGAPLLSDPIPEVRTRAACLLIAGAR